MGPARHHSWPLQATGEASLELVILFSSLPETRAVLHKAAALGTRLNARFTILVPQVVPYPRALDNPPVDLKWLRYQFELLGRSTPVRARVEIGLCRDRLTFLEQALPPASTILVAQYDRIGAHLSSLGHIVIPV